jgi:hypothetical protein
MSVTKSMERAWAKFAPELKAVRELNSPQMMSAEGRDKALREALQALKAKVSPFSSRYTTSGNQEALKALAGLVKGTPEEFYCWLGIEQIKAERKG